MSASKTAPTPCLDSTQCPSAVALQPLVMARRLSDKENSRNIGQSPPATAGVSLTSHPPSIAHLVVHAFSSDMQSTSNGIWSLALPLSVLLTPSLASSEPQLCSERNLLSETCIHCSLSSTQSTLRTSVVLFHTPALQ